MSFHKMAAAVLVVVSVAAPGRAETTPVRLNTIGFLPDGPKRAAVAAGSAQFVVVRESDGTNVFSGRLSPPRRNQDTGEVLTVADFSAVKEPGTYQLEVPGVGRSPTFKIASDVYDAPFRTVVRGMYLWRCGTAVSGTYNGQTFAHGPCHLDDAYLDFVGGGHVKRIATKGWHDAGDYNKYVVNAGFSVGVMLQAWEQFSDRIKHVRLDLPESGNGTPDFLNEVRWELDWLLSMQAEDGSVYHKVSARKFCGFIMPEADRAERYFVPWSSAATADFVAVMAMAARDYEPYDKPFASRCLAAARKSYEFLRAHPQEHRADQHGFSTGPYDASDASPRLWCAVELWQTTGDRELLNDFETRAKAQPHKADWSCGWGNVKNLAVYTYLLSRRDGRDPALVDAVKKDLLSTADNLVKTGDAHGYARPLGTSYYWGCNGDVAQQVQTLQVANKLAPSDQYKETSLDAIGYLFGRNPFGRSFVTGLGHDPPMHPHDRRSGADNLVDPWPGYLVGGAWPKATDWEDQQANYRVNEIAINWNATLIYALAVFVRPN